MELLEVFWGDIQCIRSQLFSSQFQHIEALQQQLTADQEKKGKGRGRKKKDTTAASSVVDTDEGSNMWCVVQQEYMYCAWKCSLVIYGYLAIYYDIQVIWSECGACVTKV